MCPSYQVKNRERAPACRRRSSPGVGQALDCVHQRPAQVAFGRHVLDAIPWDRIGIAGQPESHEKTVVLPGEVALEGSLGDPGLDPADDAEKQSTFRVHGSVPSTQWSRPL
jgi:hypothetical protein